MSISDAVIDEGREVAFIQATIKRLFELADGEFKSARLFDEQDECHLDGAPLDARSLQICLDVAEQSTQLALYFQNDKDNFVSIDVMISGIDCGCINEVYYSNYAMHETNFSRKLNSCLIAAALDVGQTERLGIELNDMATWRDQNTAEYTFFDDNKFKLFAKAVNNLNHASDLFLHFDFDIDSAEQWVADLNNLQTQMPDASHFSPHTIAAHISRHNADKFSAFILGFMNESELGGHTYQEIHDLLGDGNYFTIKDAVVNNPTVAAALSRAVTKSVSATIETAMPKYKQLLNDFYDFDGDCYEPPLR